MNSPKYQDPLINEIWIDADRIEEADPAQIRNSLRENLKTVSLALKVRILNHPQFIYRSTIPPLNL